MEREITYSFETKDDINKYPPFIETIKKDGFWIPFPRGDTILTRKPNKIGKYLQDPIGLIIFGKLNGTYLIIPQNSDTEDEHVIAERQRLRDLADKF